MEKENKHTTNTIIVTTKPRIQEKVSIEELSSKPSFKDKYGKTIFRIFFSICYFLFLLLFSFFVVTPLVYNSDNVVIQNFLSFFFFSTICLNLTGLTIVGKTHSISQDFSLLFLISLCYIDFLLFPTEYAEKNLSFIFSDENNSARIFSLIGLGLVFIITISPLFLRKVLVKIKFNFVTYLFNLICIFLVIPILTQLFKIKFIQTFLVFIKESFSLDRESLNQIVYHWINFWNNF